MRHGLLIAALLALSVGVAAEDHLGARRCKACHERQYVQWKTTPHARAFEALRRGEARDARCLACHATGSQSNEGVQCEACHGPGRHYWPEYVMRDEGLARAVGLVPRPDEAVCGRCHTADSPALRPFDYATARQKVVHRP